MNNAIVLAILLMITSCGSFQAKRVEAPESDKRGLEITDGWLAKDTTLVVDELIQQMEAHQGLRDFKADLGARKIKLFVAEIQNLTAEPYFPISDINDEFLFKVSQSGSYTLVAAAHRRDILNELRYQNDGLVDPRDIKKMGLQAGADIMIFGNVFMKPESRNGKTLKEYGVNLILADVETGVEVARMRKRIYKYSNKRSWGF